MIDKKGTILVTGGAGYIGSAITKQLIEAGFEVVVFDDLSAGQEEKVPSEAKFIKGNMINESDLETVFKDNKFNSVIHCAAKKIMSESECEPSMYFQNNVGGTLNLLSAMEKYQVPQIIFSSTAAVYAPTTDTTPVNELAPVEPVSVYGRSKMMAEMLIREFARCKKIKSYTVLRYFNVAGDVGLNYKEKNPQGVFPLIAKAVKNNFPFTVTGTDYNTKDGSGVRDYIHLEDLARAHVLTLKNKHCEVLNLGTSTGYTVFELIKTFEEVIGKEIEVKSESRRAGDLAVMLADSSRANEMLDWKPKKSLTEMVESVVAVYDLK